VLWHFRLAKAVFDRFSLCALPMAEWRSQYLWFSYGKLAEGHFRRAKALGTAKPLEKTAWSGEASLPKGQTTRKYDEAIHASTEI